VYIVGNGASAAMASHVAADACKNGELRAQAFTDPSLFTAIGTTSRSIRSSRCRWPASPVGRSSDHHQQFGAITKRGASVGMCPFDVAAYRHAVRPRR
jgi:hypothetical protein